MAKVVKFNAEQKKVLSDIEKRVAANLEKYTQHYSASALDEIEYLIADGFYKSIPEAIALDIFLSADFEDIKIFNKRHKRSKVA